MAPPRRKIRKVTGKTKLGDALPQDLARALKTRKLENLTFADVDTIDKQLQKYYERDPVSFFNATWRFYAAQGDCGSRCYCM